jgi:predicted amidohydrolase
MPGEAEKIYCAIAKAQNVWLVPGSLSENLDGKIYNTTPVINSQGEVVTRYRKMFPFLPYEKGVEAGSEFCVFDVPDVGRFGVSICYDMWIPETTRTLAWMGAEVILHPTMTGTIDRDVEISIARSNAVTNQCYFFDINVAGRLGNGRSVVVGPSGEVIYQAGENHEVIPIEIDLDVVRRSRERGLMGLGQPLKSFRDTDVTFPPYKEGHNKSEALQALGKLEVPGARDGNWTHQNKKTGTTK